LYPEFYAGGSKYGTMAVFKPQRFLILPGRKQGYFHAIPVFSWNEV
jgi:hypothetical protein